MSGNRPLSRREMLRGGFLGGMLEQARDLVSEAAPQECPAAGAPPSARYKKSFPVVRPPGAVEEEEFLAGCTRCEACIQACPHQAIIHAPPRFRRAAGTPMLDPVRQPCWMCEGFPCIAACEPKVLRLELPKRMATVQIEPFNCLAHQGAPCDACSTQCPVPDALEVAEGKPRIVEDRCTGCGVCQHVCPAPMNAVLLMPLAERPGAPSAETSDDQQRE